MRRGRPGRPVALVLVLLLLAAAGGAMALPVRPTSIANVQLLSEGKVQVALVQNDIAFYVHPGALRLYRERNIQQ